MLRERPSGDLFGWTQNAGMGWEPAALGGSEFLILSHARRHSRRRRHADRARLSHRALGSRAADGSGGRASSRRAGAIPFAGVVHRSVRRPLAGHDRRCSTACRIRNDAAIVFRRLIRSLPTRRGVLGVATCDKGLPAMMMALAGERAICPCVLVPGGVTLPPSEGEDAGARADDRRALRARRDHARGRRRPRLPRLRARRAAAASSSAPPRPSQVVGEALGMSLRPFRARALGTADLARHGAAIGARADGARAARHHACATSSPTRRVHNAMVVARGVRRIDEPASCTCRRSRTPRGCAGRPSQDWARVNRQVPRLVDALPNGPRNHPTVQVFLAGGVPEVMLHLRRAGLLDTRVLTVSGDHARRAARLRGKSSERRARAARGCCGTRRRRSRRRDHVAGDGAARAA